MTSAANLLVGTHQLHLDDEHIDKMIYTRMNKRLTEIVRTKKAFSSVKFSDVFSDKSVTL